MVCYREVLALPYAPWNIAEAANWMMVQIRSFNAGPLTSTPYIRNFGIRTGRAKLL